MSMAINFGRVWIYNKEFLSTKLPDHLITWSCKVTWNILVCTTAMTRPMTNKLGKVVTCYTKLQPISHTTLWIRGHLGHVINQKHFISTTRIPMATKPGRVITYYEELPSIKPNEPLIMCSSDFDFSLQLVGLECQCLSRHRLLVLKKKYLLLSVQRLISGNVAVRHLCCKGIRLLHKWGRHRIDSIFLAI